MATDPSSLPSPSEFRGNFAGYIEALQHYLEAAYGGDAGEYESVVDRAAAEARFIAAQTWLVERWGNHYQCPVCGNVGWVLSDVALGPRPAGFLSFYVTCGFCGNTMHVVPGRAEQDTPIFPTNQFQLPDQ